MSTCWAHGPHGCPRGRLLYKEHADTRQGVFIRLIDIDMKFNTALTIAALLSIIGTCSASEDPSTGITVDSLIKVDQSGLTSSDSVKPILTKPNDVGANSTVQQGSGDTIPEPSATPESHFSK